ncbi:PepSY-associated TM helix domain-containing protein [Roseateles sp.]|uniref:PepSY-associated TM helix domain-containing protein n=1 Tax=Roseateles sp. TaxID=1971397 RepID=UPI0039EBEE50
MIRPVLVLVHRWVGLVIAGFLLLAGLTGSLLAWYDELEVAISPQLFRVSLPGEGVPMLDPVLLREQFLARHPGAVMPYLPLHAVPGQSLQFFVEAQTDTADDQFFVDPYTGGVLGSRKWGDVSQGFSNLMPFIYRLHQQLALGVVGTYAFGVIALMWTLDCFIGAYLTFPARARQGVARAGKSWWTRWRPSWRVRWTGGAYKLNFDLHRAGGLWVWAMLFVLAWSSVAFNLTEVYNPVMRAMFAHQPDEKSASRLASPRQAPALDWPQARERGRELMAEQAQRLGFVVHHEDSLLYLATHGLYRYDVHSSLDLRERGGYTQVYFDGDTGALRATWLPTGGAAGDTVRTWLTSLHMALVWGLPMKLFMSAMGLAVAMLVVTGVVIWWRKRRARG